MQRKTSACVIALALLFSTSGFAQSGTTMRRVDPPAVIAVAKLAAPAVVREDSAVASGSSAIGVKGSQVGGVTPAGAVTQSHKYTFKLLGNKVVDRSLSGVIRVTGSESVAIDTSAPFKMKANLIICSGSASGGAKPYGNTVTIGGRKLVDFGVTVSFDIDGKCSVVLAKVKGGAGVSSGIAISPCTATSANCLKATLEPFRAHADIKATVLGANVWGWKADKSVGRKEIARISL